MKLPKGCIHWNSDLEEGVGTPSWGKELGQGRPDYLMNQEGCSAIINGMVYNRVEIDGQFEYGQGGGSFSKVLLALFDRTYIDVYDGETKAVHHHAIARPFIVLLVQEQSASHAGRRVIKVNKAFECAGKKNDDFYDKVDEMIGRNNPWFARDLIYDVNSGELTLVVIKAPKRESAYANAEERTKIWDDLISEYEATFPEGSVARRIYLQSFRKPILRESNIGRFIYLVLRFLEAHGLLHEFMAKLAPNADENNLSLRTEEASLTSIFKKSAELLTDEDLSSGENLDISVSTLPMMVAIIT